MTPAAPNEDLITVSQTDPLINVDLWHFSERNKFLAVRRRCHRVRVSGPSSPSEFPPRRINHSPRSDPIIHSLARPIGDREVDLAAAAELSIPVQLPEI